MTNKRFQILQLLGLLLLALLISFNTFAAANLPKHSPVPGGIAVIDLPSSTQPPTAFYRGNRVLVTGSQQTGWYAITGIALKATPGNHHIQLGDGQKIAFNVKPKTYKEQRITLTNKRQVNPAPMDLERIGREKKVMVAAFKHWNEQLTPSLTLLKPVQGPYSSPFGLKRFFNDQPRNPHSGLDIAAAEGSPIQAPAKAIVAATGDYFFNGKTILLDHGQGLISMYCHLSEINVAKGDIVNTKDIIGQVGKTGRVTGPHLHWSVSLNNARINPFLLMSDEPDILESPE